jgi:hypothetical protein
MKENNNPFAQQFESWAETVAEGTWAIPDSDDEIGDLIELFGEPLPVGVDGQNATNALYNILGDDQLFDRLEELATADPEADARETIISWLYDNAPSIYQQLMNEIGDDDVPAEPGEQEIDEGVMGELHAELSDKYNELAPGIEKHKDTAGAENLYKELEAIARKHGASAEFARMCRGARNSAHMDYDTNPGGFENWFWYLGLGDDLDEGTQTMEDDHDEDQVESIQTAIIRRILNNLEQHSELLMKAGPDGVMNAARDVASFHAPMEELGSSDISIMVREVYNEVGVEYPEMNEAKDTIKYDPKTGKLTGWEHEGDWKKQTKKDPVGKIHHMSDVARRRTEKMAQDTLEEAFAQALGEYDTRDAYELDDPKHPDFVKNYQEFKAKNPDAKLADFIAHLRSRKNESVAGDDHVNKDEKLKRMGAKDLSIMDKLKMMPRQMKAMAKGDSEDDLVNYNKQFNEEIAQMRRIAGLE